jgi:hypothetical protein
MAALAALTLAACDGGAPAANETATVKTIRASSEYIDGLRALSEANRGLALRRAIQDSGEYCKRADSSGYQQDYENLSMWTVRCSDGGDWALFIAPNGDVQVRNCAEVVELGLPGCRFEATEPS